MISNQKELKKLNPNLDEDHKREKTPLFFSQEKKDEIYCLAYTLYKHQRYQDAAIFFRLLISSFPYERKGWKGLGASMQMQQDYHEALDCYCVCANFDHDRVQDPYLYTQSADCYFALQQIEMGLKALKIAQSIAAKTGDQRVLKHVTFMQQVWKKQVYHE